jgi:ATP-binding cassette subfamily B protein
VLDGAPVSLTGTARRLRLWWAELSFGTYHPSRRLAALAALGSLAGLGETATILLIVTLAAPTGTHRAFGGTLPTAPWTLAAIVLAVLTGLAAVYVASARLTARVGADALRSLRTGLIDAYLGASWSTQSAVHAGELPELVMTNANQVAFGTQQAAAGIASLLNLAVVIVAAIALSWWSLVGLAVVGGLTVAVVRPSRVLVRRLATTSAASSATVSRSVAETVALARELRTFDATGAASARLGAAVQANAADFEATQIVSSAVPSVTRAGTLALLAVALAAITSHGGASLAQLGAVVILLLRALGQAQAISATVNLLSQRAASLKRVRWYLDHWQASSGRRGTRPCPSVGDIAFDRVSYRYPAPPDTAVLVARSARGASVAARARRGEEPPALDRLDLRIARGEQVGLVGPTGAGKSTLAGILLGVLHPEEGRVLVDGTPLDEFRPEEWHRRVGWVPQDPKLLSGTVADNIRFFRDTLDEEGLERAAHRAGLDAERAAWPEGLDRPVGVGGIALSGGQRQRVTLARALAGDPDLIVLDEPTSAVDAQSEAAIRSSLAELRGRVTVLIIAHRASTLEACDRVIRLDAGRVVAGGQPADGRGPPVKGADVVR